jgi:hypothetical protein
MPTIRASVPNPIRKFLDLPDPLIRCTDPDPSIMKQTIVRKTFCDLFMTFIIKELSNCSFKKY